MVETIAQLVIQLLAVVALYIKATSIEKRVGSVAEALRMNGADVSGDVLHKRITAIERAVPPLEVRIEGNETKINRVNGRLNQMEKPVSAADLIPEVLEKLREAAEQHRRSAVPQPEPENGSTF